MCVTLFAAVLGSAVFALLPPLVLAKAIDYLTAGQTFPFALALSYFGLLLLTNAATSLRESLLTIFGQRITHGLRTVLCQKISLLPADSFVSHDSGAIASRFVGDVDTVEELFTSGIISMFADACQLCGIFFVIFTKNRGLAILLLFVLPAVFFYTRHVQKRMLASQLSNLPLQKPLVMYRRHCAVSAPFTIFTKKCIWKKNTVNFWKTAIRQLIKQIFMMLFIHRSSLFPIQLPSPLL